MNLNSFTNFGFIYKIEGEYKCCLIGKLIFTQLICISLFRLVHCSVIFSVLDSLQRYRKKALYVQQLQIGQINCGTSTPFALQLLQHDIGAYLIQERSAQNEQLNEEKSVQDGRTCISAYSAPMLGKTILLHGKKVKKRNVKIVVNRIIVLE